MDWIERLNSAINYIEENICGDIAIERAAKIACCSAYHFQRMFAYMIAPLEFDHQGNMDDWLIIEKIQDVVVGTSIPFNYEKSRF